MRIGTRAIAALAAAVALPSLVNGFVYDDVPVILQNPLVHGLARSAEIWRSSYWPAGLLYRPLTAQLFAAEWAAGGGRPLVFHAVSVALAAVVAVLVFRLARHLLPSPAALAAGALFAVHPVHVEVVANVVGQSELLAAVWALLAVERYLVWRRQGDLTARQRVALAGLTLLAILAKETGYVVPLLLAAAEGTVLRERRARIAPAFLLQGAVIVSALLVRLIVLGSLVGESPSAVFQSLGLGSRALAMLAVVPEWARLFLWPVHLQAEYGPPALPILPALGPPQLLGLLILVFLAALGLGSWRRSPVVGFALAWIVLALAPVSNVAAATGLVTAERVLFLPSVGVVLVIGTGLAAVARRIEGGLAWTRPAAVAFALAVLAAAGARSVLRTNVWHSQEGFFARLLQDAPRTYRAHLVAAHYYYGERRFLEAEQAGRRALALYARDPHVHEQLGQVLRVEGRCDEAIPVLTEGVRLWPAGTTVRSRLIECALAIGDTVRARSVASEAVRLGQSEFAPTLRRLP